MKDIIEVFRMNEIPAGIRCKIIIKLGIAINNEYGANMTEAIVYELVKYLDPENEILENENYKRHL